MIGNTFGKLFRVTTFGESHGEAVGCIIDGCPSGVEISELDIQAELDLRRPGQSKITTDRNEDDKAQILSGVFDGVTTGTPICIIIKNKDQKSQDYSEIKDIFRPSHADFTYQQKYGIRDYRGGGRTSARETVARVAAGAVAKKILDKMGVFAISFVEQVCNIRAEIDENLVLREDIFSNIIRCPDQKKATEMIELIEKMKEEGDSVGGVIKGVISGLWAGIGTPVFSKLNAELAHAMMGINAVKGFEIGSGFASIELKGSEHNDQIEAKNGKISTKTNHAGGIVGGLSNGENITFRVAFKPISTIKKPQKTVNMLGENVELENIKGRHDPCVLPRAVPIVDAMARLVILDQIMLDQASRLEK